MNKAMKARLETEERKVWGSDDRMVKFCTNKAEDVFEVNGIMAVYDKPGIKKTFWFGEHGFDFDEKQEQARNASKDEEYFISHNMKHTDAANMLERIANGGKPCYSRKAYCRQSEDCILGHYSVKNQWDITDGFEYEVMNEEETARFVEFLNARQEAFEKRLHTYLKRYGLSKCRFSTFWADR